MSDVLVHVVLVSFYAHVPQSVRDAKYAFYQGLGDGWGGKAAGILFWHAGWNLGPAQELPLNGIWRLCRRGRFSEV